jgi:hypothetical protein
VILPDDVQDDGVHRLSLDELLASISDLCRQARRRTQTEAASAPADRSRARTLELVGGMLEEHAHDIDRLRVCLERGWRRG